MLFLHIFKLFPITWTLKELVDDIFDRYIIYYLIYNKYEVNTQKESIYYTFIITYTSSFFNYWKVLYIYNYIYTLRESACTGMGNKSFNKED